MKERLTWLPARKTARGGDRRMLPQGGAAGPMPWIVAVMMFLTVVTAAAGIGLSQVASRLGSGGGISVEIVSADPVVRARDSAAVLAILGHTAGIVSARLVPEAEIARSLEPWLGDAKAAGVPLPIIVEADNRAGEAAIQPLRAALAKAAPSARLTTSAEWLAPLARLVDALRWLAAGILILVASAAIAIVTLTARATLDRHRDTIELLHLIGATDDQVGRIVQRRIAADALMGSTIGGGGAILFLILIARRIAAIGSELLAAPGAPEYAWLTLLLLPPAGALVAMLVARRAVFRALKQFL